MKKDDITGGSSELLTDILIFTTDFDHPLVARVHYLVDYLAKRGVIVKVINIPFEGGNGSFKSLFSSIFSFPRKAREPETTTTILRLPRMPRKLTGTIGSITNIFHLILAQILIRTTLKTSKYPVIVGIGPLAGFIANFCNNSKNGIIYEDTDPWSELSKGKIQKRFVSFLETYCIRRASLVISNSELLTKRAQRINSNSIFIPNGVDLSKFRKKRVTPDNPTLIYMGSLVEWAGLDLVVKAFPELAKRIPRITMNVCGDGVDRQKLEKLVENGSLRNHISFRGKVPYSQLQSLLFSSDVGIAMMRPNNFTYFASPLKLFEYMATGLPVVATDIGQLGRTIRKSGAGLCVNWIAKDFVEAVQKLLTDKDLWTKCHKNALQYVSGYDWNILFDKWFSEVERHIASKN